MKGSIYIVVKGGGERKKVFPTWYVAPPILHARLSKQVFPFIPE